MTVDCAQVSASVLLYRHLGQQKLHTDGFFLVVGCLWRVSLFASYSSVCFAGTDNFRSISQFREFSDLSDNSFEHPAKSNPTLFRLGEGELSKALAFDPVRVGEAPRAALALAQAYLAYGRPMEAVFALEDGGLYSLAETIAGKIERRLQIGKLKIGHRIK